MICVIDDDTVYRFALKLKVKHLCGSSDFLEFANGQDAIQYFESHLADALPKVVLIDLNMPIVDGWQFLDWIEMHIDGMPNKPEFYIVSSSIDEFDLKRSKEYFCLKGFLNKPITDEQLLDFYA